MSDKKSAAYFDIAQNLATTVVKKQAAYGDSFGKSGEIIRILYPDGVPPSKVDDMLTVTRIVDKLFRIATDRDALGESPWRDVMGYALLAVERLERQRAALDSSPSQGAPMHHIDGLG